jgi:hypothetical protein
VGVSQGNKWRSKRKFTGVGRSALQSLQQTDSGIRTASAARAVHQSALRAGHQSKDSTSKRSA